MEKNGRGVDVSVSRQADMDMELLQQKLNSYADMLYKLAFLQLGNRQDAEDVVQETFYQYIKSKKTFESSFHERAWLIKVAMNGCRRLWRCAWRRHTTAMTDREFSAENSMEQAVVEQERKKEVMEAVMKLPGKYREVIHLFYFQDMSVKEICLVTDRKESTVTSQLTRGRALLRKHLGEEYHYE